MQPAHRRLRRVGRVRLHGGVRAAVPRTRVLRARAARAGRRPRGGQQLGDAWRRCPTPGRLHDAAGGVDRRFVERAAARRVHAATSSTRVLAAEIEGRPITEAEAIGTIQLLILGGPRDDRRRARACDDPVLRAPGDPRDVARRSRSGSPTRSRSCCGSTARSSASAAPPATTPRSAASRSRQGEPVLIYWASANRDEAEFANPDTSTSTARATVTSPSVPDRTVARVPTSPA